MGTATPTGVVITATSPTGDSRNITEGVQVLYDLVIASMDWGSGFLTVEDVEPIVALAQFCGFKNFEEAADYIAEARTKEKQRACDHPTWRVEPDTSPPNWPGYAWLACEECGLRRFGLRDDLEIRL